MMVEKYEQSGRVGATGLPVMALIGGVSAILLGVVYVYGIAWIPILYASILLTGGFGFVLGVIVGWAGKVGKVRNSLVVGLMGFFTGALGLYVAWAFDGIARFGAADFPGILLSPNGLMSYMTVFYNEGFWSMGRNGGAVSGMPLAGIWIVEALIIAGVPGLVATSFTSDLPFCEACHRWTDKVEGLCQLHPPEDDDTAMEKLCEGDVSVIERFSKSPADAAAYIRLDTAQCPDCDQCNCLTVNLAQITLDKDGDASTNVTAIAQNLMLSSSAMEELRESVDGLPAAVLPDPVEETEEEV